MKTKACNQFFTLIICISCILAFASGCSGKKKSEEGTESPETATMDAGTPDLASAGTDAVPTSTAEGNVAPTAEEAALPPPPTEDPSAQVANPIPEESPAPEGVNSNDVKLAEEKHENIAEQAAPLAASQETSTEFSPTYTFQSGDTLMKIAFENYGDLYRWKKIYEDNRDKIQNPNAVPVGTVLKLEKPSSPVTIDRNGEKVVIRSGDTLGKISNRVYGTLKKWKRLWENNKQMIRDPNRIFAGFSLYYTFTDEDRQYLEKHQVNARVPASGQ